MRLEVLQRQSLRPIPLVQVHQHALLKLRLAVVHRDGVIVSVQAVDESLNGRLVNVTDVGRRLPWLAAGYHGLWLNETEGVDNNFAFDGLNGVDDHCDGALVK